MSERNLLALRLHVGILGIWTGNLQEKSESLSVVYRVASCPHFQPYLFIHPSFTVALVVLTYCSLAQASVPLHSKFSLYGAPFLSSYLFISTLIPDITAPLKHFPNPSTFLMSTCINWLLHCIRIVVCLSNILFLG